MPFKRWGSREKEVEYVDFPAVEQANKLSPSYRLLTKKSRRQPVTPRATQLQCCLCWFFMVWMHFLDSLGRAFAKLAKTIKARARIPPGKDVAAAAEPCVNNLDDGICLMLQWSLMKPGPRFPFRAFRGCSTVRWYGQSLRNATPRDLGVGPIWLESITKYAN